MRKWKSTQVELVFELREIHARLERGSHPERLLAHVIDEAIKGEFHDYKNQKYACGKVALVALLDECRLSDISARVKLGEFDEQADEADKETLRRMLKPHMWEFFGLERTDH